MNELTTDPPMVMDDPSKLFWLPSLKNYGISFYCSTDSNNPSFQIIHVANPQNYGIISPNGHLDCAWICDFTVIEVNGNAISTLDVSLPLLLISSLLLSK